MANGYQGRVLHVNLTDRTMVVEEPPEAFYRTYMGGSALNLHYLLKEMPAGLDPLEPGNILGLSVGERRVTMMRAFNARDEYYRQSGWDVASGIPTRRTLEEVGLGRVA